MSEQLWDDGYIHAEVTSLFRRALPGNRYYEVVALMQRMRADYEAALAAASPPAEEPGNEEPATDESWRRWVDTDPDDQTE